jgi:hypothetical protein
MRLCLILAYGLTAIATAAVRPPSLAQVYPLGGQAGSTIMLELLGDRLANVLAVEFDCKDLAWKATAGPADARKLVGQVVIKPNTPTGPHTLRVRTPDGPSNSLIFNVGHLRGLPEAEPNNDAAHATLLKGLPADAQGRLEGAPDIDVFAFDVSQGQRLVFDLRSIEEGSAVETRMILLDSSGHQIHFNDDRNDFNENPLIEHTFESAGRYYLKLDQYRGPRGFNFGKLCAYILRVGALPVVSSTLPLAVQVGTKAVIDLKGSGLDRVQRVTLTEFRQAEYSRMTYPYTIPIHFRADPLTGAQLSRIRGRIVQRTPSALRGSFRIPPTAKPGLYRLLLDGLEGSLGGVSVQLVQGTVIGEAAAKARKLRARPLTISGSVASASEKDAFDVQARAGDTLHFKTVAAQIGVAHLDSVLTLRDSSGKKLVESDDVVAGQGTLLGNPDSSLFFKVKEDGVYTVEVRDRLRRGAGAGFEYALHLDLRRPSFQLFTTPENFTVVAGETGEVKVHLVRETGFEGEVDIWFEGLPGLVSGPRGQFRKDQLFEPNADGADMIIPEIAFRIEVPKSLPAGTYPIRILGRPAALAGQPTSASVEAHATLMLGPLLDVWNYMRRPLPAITLTVLPSTFTRELSDVRDLKPPLGERVRPE